MVFNKGIYFINGSKIILLGSLLLLILNIIVRFFYIQDFGFFLSTLLHSQVAWKTVEPLSDTLE